MFRPSIPNRLLYCVLACWLILVTVGILILKAHSTRSGDQGSPPTRWPATTSLRLDRSRHTLLIFVHPRCVCSRASVAELAKILTRCRGRVSAIAVIYRPERATEQWSEAIAGIEQAVSELGGVGLHDDLKGNETKRFGVSTSGQVLLFDPLGRRIFAGGITGSRGHEGENRGRDEVVARVLASEDRRASYNRPMLPVFGCPIVTRRARFKESD